MQALFENIDTECKTFLKAEYQIQLDGIAASPGLAWTLMLAYSTLRQWGKSKNKWCLQIENDGRARRLHAFNRVL